MNEGCFQSASLCGKDPYIGDLYLQNFLILLYILWNTEAAILTKILPDATFSGIPLTASFLRERIHCENLYENHLLHFFWSLWSSFASNTADFEISIFNLTHKVPPNTSFEIRKSLKRMQSLAYTEMDQTKHRVSSMFAFGCIIWTLLHVFTCTYSGWLISEYKIIGKKMVYHSDEIPPDIGFSLTGLLPTHFAYWNFDTIKIVLSGILVLRPLL